ncbi:MAG: BspA family leucine-rich repeat surface protein [Bacteroidota bacterium]
MKKIICLGLSVLLFLACSNDDNEPTPVPAAENTAPVIEAQTFTVSENLDPSNPFGPVKAQDDDGDAISFSITVNDNNLFRIDESTGEIRLEEGKALDFESFEDGEPQHIITVKVEDDQDKATAQITIKVTNTNDVAPTFAEASYSFEVFEDITENTPIGNVEGSDPEGTNVSYSIIEDSSELFDIDESTGDISLAAGKQLDFEAFQGAAPLYEIVVQVSDGELNTEITVAITIKNIPEAHPDDQAAFVTTWETFTEGEFTNAILISTNTDFARNFTVNWGDGTVESFNLLANEPGEFVFHEYDAAGIYTVSIIGTLALTPSDSLIQESLLSIEQWGHVQWKSMENAFSSCENMVYNAKDVPDLSQVNSLRGMFQLCTAFDGDLRGWNVETITNMEAMFLLATAFTGIGLETWNTQNVENMSDMFSGAALFNGNIDGWDTQNVQFMNDMFSSATAFEGAGLENWNTENVSNMRSMFSGAISFNGEIGGWNTQNVLNMIGMFFNAQAFDQNLGGWDISSIIGIGLSSMLSGTKMSIENYSNTLIGWSTLDEGEEQVPEDMNLGADGLLICAGSLAAERRDFLKQEKGWVIFGDGVQNCF